MEIIVEKSATQSKDNSQVNSPDLRRRSPNPATNRRVSSVANLEPKDSKNQRSPQNVVNAKGSVDQIGQDNNNNNNNDQGQPLQIVNNNNSGARRQPIDKLLCIDFAENNLDSGPQSREGSRQNSRQGSSRQVSRNRQHRADLSLFSGQKRDKNPADQTQQSNRSLLMSSMFKSYQKKMTRLLENNRIFQTCPTCVKNFAIKPPQTTFTKLNTSDILKIKDNVKALDFMLVLKGSVSVEMEMLFTHQAAENSKHEKNKKLLNIEEMPSSSDHKDQTSSLTATNPLNQRDIEVSEVESTPAFSLKNKRSPSKNSVSTNPKPNQSLQFPPQQLNIFLNSSHNKKAAGSVKRSETDQNCLYMEILQGEWIDPDLFVTDKVQIKTSQLNQMPYLEPLTQKGGNQYMNQSIKSGHNSKAKFGETASITGLTTTTGRVPVQNPVFGYRIKEIKALEDGTEVQTIDSDIYRQFLSKKHSPFVDITDKELLEQIINEFCLQDAKSKWRQRLFHMFKIEKIHPKQVLIREGQIPDKVYMLFQGEVEMYCRAGAEAEGDNKHKQIAKTVPGPQVLKQTTNEDFGKLTTVFHGDIKRMTPIGCDPLLLNMTSPQTFVSRYGGYALTLDADQFVKQIVTQPASIVETLAKHCSRRQKQFTELNKKQYKTAFESKRMTPDMSFKLKKDKECTQTISTNYQIGSTSIRQTLWKENKVRMHENTVRGFHGQKPTPKNGSITHQDMVKLQILKNTYFLDRNAVDQHLINQDIRIGKGQPGQKIQPVKHLMRKDSKGLGLLDQNCLPLSSSLITDKQEVVTFKNMKTAKPGEQGFYVEHYPNKYYETWRNNQDHKAEQKNEVSNAKAICRVHPFDKTRPKKLVTPQAKATCWTTGEVMPEEGVHHLPKMYPKTMQQYTLMQPRSQVQSPQQNNLPQPSMSAGYALRTGRNSLLPVDKTCDLKQDSVFGANSTIGASTNNFQMRSNYTKDTSFNMCSSRNDKSTMYKTIQATMTSTHTTTRANQYKKASQGGGNAAGFFMNSRLNTSNTRNDSYSIYTTGERVYSPAYDGINHQDHSRANSKIPALIEVRNSFGIVEESFMSPNAFKSIDTEKVGYMPSTAHNLQSGRSPRETGRAFMQKTAGLDNRSNY